MRFMGGGGKESFSLFLFWLGRLGWAELWIEREGTGKGPNMEEGKGQE